MRLGIQNKDKGGGICTSANGVFGGEYEDNFEFLLESRYKLEFKVKIQMNRDGMGIKNDYEK